MPLLSNGMQHAPSWCEMTDFQIVSLAAGESRTFPRQAARERLLVTDGTCQVSIGDATHEAATGDKYEIPDDLSAYTVVAGAEGAGVVTLSGNWGTETGGWGLFSVIEEEAPERGDPTDYPKRTRIDNHYHDCDEFYIILSGRGTVVSETIHYAVGPGDCIATGMGHHHDVSFVESPMRAVFFETTLQGRKRRGHLWNHTHGPAEPQPDRI
jgi:mannose-6-phosphate isomerase-like protein (cupin superfamily)